LVQIDCARGFSEAGGLVPHVGRRCPERRDRCDDAEPRVGPLFVALASHRLDHLASLRECVIAMLLNPEMSGSIDVEVGD
jgi:hypothetical protein